MSSSKSLVVIGGGAAGFFCAVNAARMNPSLKVVLVEKSHKLLAKVKVSGGGRCNVTHACFDIAEMSSCYPRGHHFVKKAFHHFFTTGTMQWFAERRVQLKTEKDGRVFPVTDSSQTIIDCLLQEANRYAVEIVMNAEVTGCQFANEKFSIELTGHRKLATDYLCIASGGYPKSSQFGWLKQTGHSIEEPVPSLFTFNMPKHPLTALMGISVENTNVKITGTKLEQEGPLLITHWGLSGPVVLKLSAWGARELAARHYEFGITVNWLPAFGEQQLREKFAEARKYNASQKVSGKNNFGLPGRLWEFLGDQSGVTSAMRWADLPSPVQNKFIKNLRACEYNVKGKTTFKEEFVTAGGIKLSEVEAGTMMSKIIPGLFFAGEVLDVDGITGGYNFQHAWTSGWVAAKTIADLSK